MFKNCICYPVVVRVFGQVGGIPGTLLIDRHAEKPFKKGELCTGRPLNHKVIYELEYTTKANAEVLHAEVAAVKDNGKHQHNHCYVVMLS